LEPTGTPPAMPMPITGRIVAVADVFDALTHVRPYKPAWPVADAEVELRTRGGLPTPRHGRPYGA
jgi:hypothetical protein